MSALTGLQCHMCKTAFPAEALYVCDRCLGPLEPVYDYGAIRLTRAEIERRPKNLWRYRELLPIAGAPLTGFNSGFTPLVRCDRLAREIGVSELYIKDDCVVSVAGTRALELGYKVLACASTGKLANSVAAHAARLGVECCVFIPDNLEAGKLLGSAIFRPTVLAIAGTYDDVNRLCTQVADRYGWGFVNINLRSYYAEGAKTYGFEIAEQLGWRYPRHLVAPVAGGTLLPRIVRGLRELGRIGLVDGELPRVYAAQAAGCAPVVRALEAGLDQPGGRFPGRARGEGDGRQRRDGHRRGDSRRHPAARAHGRHLHRAGGRHDARRHDRSGRARRHSARRIDCRLRDG